MPRIGDRSKHRRRPTPAINVAALVAALVVSGCSAQTAGNLDAPSTSPLSGTPPPAATTAPSPSTPSPIPTPTASPAAATPTPTVVSTATPVPTATPQPPDPTPPPATGIRTFPVDPDGDCDGMAATDPTTLTLDLSQPERDAALLTDKVDWNVHVVWPEGFSVTGSGDDRVLRDDHGKIVGRQGDDVTIPAEVIFPSGALDEPIVAEGMLFGRCHRRAVAYPTGSVVRTTKAGLRLRGAPGTSGDAPIIHPGLPVGDDLYVLDGPVFDDGYAWYRVDWLEAGRPMPFGWVATADRDSTRYVAPGTLSCPSSPRIPSQVALLPYGYRVGCFAGQPLTIRARLVPCECNMDGPFEGMEPSWLMPDDGPDGPWLLIDPDAAGPDPTLADDLFLIRHPDSPSPDAWGGSIVRVTGMFDHPDTADCAVWVGDGPASPRDCSGTFVVTGMQPA